MSLRAATGVGLIAIPLWSSLATLTVLAKGIPPLQLVAMSFALAALTGGAVLVVRPRMRYELRQFTLPAAVLGAGGLLFYHAFYFFALSIAPPLEASLVNYLWPLLIVLLSALLPGAGRLHWHHVAGALVGLSGALLAISKGQAVQLEAGAIAGYGLALAAAVTWAGYSVLSRLFAAVPSSTVTVYCAVTAVAGGLASVILETPVWQLSTQQGLAVLALGLGPLGLAFYVWDHGCKRGDLRVLGAAAYFAPLLSSALLVACGLSEASPVLWLAAIAIAGGAVLASKDLLFRRRPAAPDARAPSQRPAA